MADLINILQDIRGSGLSIDDPADKTNALVPASADAGGIWQRTKDIQANIIDINGVADAIKTTMWGTDETNGSAGTILENVTVKSANVDTKHSDIATKYLDFAGADGNSGKYKTFFDAYNLIDVTAMNNASSISTEIVGVYTIKDNIISVDGNSTNINAVAGNKVNIDAVANNSVNINLAAGNKINIDATAGNATNINTVAGVSSKVTTVADNIVDVQNVGNQITEVGTVGTDLLLGANSFISQTAAELQPAGKLDVIYDDITNPTYSHINNAKQNALDAQAAVDGINADANRSETMSYLAEAAKRTTDSYATEPEDVPVKIWTSNGDGTYTQSDAVPTQYSAYHWKNKASGAAGDVDTSSMTFTNKFISDISNTVSANSIGVKVYASGNLVKGDVVKVTGWNVANSCAMVQKVSSINDSAIGVVSVAISDSTTGIIMNKGYVSNFDTTGLTLGSLVYSDGIGGITDTATGVNFQSIGYCLNVSNSTGAIFVECTAIEYDQGLVDNINTRETIVNNDAKLALKTDKYSYISRTTNYQASVNDYIFADTTGGVFTITLPLAPSVGDIVHILDVNSSFSANNLSVARNGQTIMGVPDDMLLDLNDLESKFIYTGSDWRVV